MSFETPILLIIFNRPDKTKLLFEKIKLIKPKKLFVSADGPRKNNFNDEKLCEETRSIVKKINWECDYKFKFSETNLSCKTNVIESINWFFSINDKGIILEDDCIPVNSFFEFCEMLLKKYKNNQEIMQINGSNLGMDFSDLIQETYYFSKLNHTWGWATWKRAWDHFDPDLKDYFLAKKKGQILEYYKDLEISNWMNAYYDKIINFEDKIWSTNWSYSIMKNNGLCISPTINLVNNIGFDGSGTSGMAKKFSKFSSNSNDEITKYIFPKDIKYNLKYDQKLFYEKIKSIDPRASKLNIFKKLFSIFKKKFK